MIKFKDKINIKNKYCPECFKTNVVIEYKEKNLELPKNSNWMSVKYFHPTSLFMGI